MPRGLSKNKQSHKEQTWERATGSVPESKLDREMNAGTILSSRAEFLCASMVFLAALLLYSWTLAPTVTLVDSGELIVVAHGFLPHALVLCDDHRSLCSQHAAHPRYLLSDASVAAAHHCRPERYRCGDGCRSRHVGNHRSRHFSLCRCPCLCARARSSSRYCGTGTSGAERRCLQD